MNERTEIIRVGISDLKIVKAPDKIRTLGLGSCMGIVLYDLSAEIGGLAHTMLPDSEGNRDKVFNPHKYADTAIDELIKLLIENGANRASLKAKIAGGAQMFKFNKSSSVVRIGPRNIETVKVLLAEKEIEIVSSDLGGEHGRTVEFDPKTGELYVRTVNRGEIII